MMIMIDSDDETVLIFEFFSLQTDHDDLIIKIIIMIMVIMSQYLMCICCSLQTCICI